MENIDSKEAIDAVNALVEKMDMEQVADKSNALTGGSLRVDDAAKVVSMVSLAAIRSPGKVVSVAGVIGRFSGGRLNLYQGVDLAAVDFPNAGGES